MTRLKLEKYFNKYNINELDVLKMIISYVHDEDMSEIYEVFDKVYKEKWKNYDEKFSVPIKPTNYSPLFILDKNTKLNDDEINFFYKLVESASFYLSSISNYQDGYKQEIEDFNISEYPIETTNKLELLLSKEVTKRKVKH